MVSILAYHSTYLFLWLLLARGRDGRDRVYALDWWEGQTILYSVPVSFPLSPTLTGACLFFDKICVLKKALHKRQRFSILGVCAALSVGSMDVLGTPSGRRTLSFHQHSSRGLWLQQI